MLCNSFHHDCSSCKHTQVGVSSLAHPDSAGSTSVVSKWLTTARKPTGVKRSKNYAVSSSWASWALRVSFGMSTWDGVIAVTVGWAHLNCKLTWLNRNADTHAAFAVEAQTGKSYIGAYDVHMYIIYIFIFLRKHCCCLCPLIYIYLFLLQYHL